MDLLEPSHAVAQNTLRGCGHGGNTMNSRIIKTQPFDMANHLGTDEDVAEYLRQVLADGDRAELAAALGDIARARGMTQLCLPSS